MKIIRLTILVVATAGIWAGSALGMPASDPDSLVTKAHKAVPPASGFDWTYVLVGLGVAAVVVLAAVGTVVGLRHRHTGTVVQV